LAGKPTIRAPKFGRWLQKRRGENRSLESVAARVRSRLEPLGVKFNRSQLKRIEDEGQVPHVLVLHQLAAVYGERTEELIRLIVAETGLSKETPQLSAEPLLSEGALRLARWFDTLPATRQRAVLDAYAVPEDAEGESARKEQFERGQAPTGRRKSSGG
jgi:hypothetical protein